MKKIYAYLDEDTDVVYLGPSTDSWYLGSVSGQEDKVEHVDTQAFPAGKPIEELMQREAEAVIGVKQNLETIKDLHRSGFSADDIVKLKAADLI